MKAYTQKFLIIARHQGGKCAIAAAHDAFAHPGSLHHRCHNTKMNRKKYPLLIDSLWNLMAVDQDWHMMHPAFGKIGPYEASKREVFLESHPAIAAAINLEGVADGVLDQFSDSDFPPYTNVLSRHRDRSIHPGYMVCGTIQRQPAVEAKHKTLSSGGDAGRDRGPGQQDPYLDRKGGETGEGSGRKQREGKDGHNLQQ